MQGFTAEYKGIKLMMYRGPTFDMEQMQSTMRRLFLDDLLRNNVATGSIAGRRVVMASETSVCSHGGKEGHLARDCWNKREEIKNPGGDAGGGDHDKKQKG